MNSHYPVSLYLFKAIIGHNRKMCKTCSKLTLNTTDRYHDVVLVSLLFTLDRFTHLSGVSDVEFKKGKYQLGMCIAQYSDGT